MKKFLFPALFLACVVCLPACSGKHKAEKTAKEFLKAYYVDYNFNKARRLSTSESYEIINEKEEMVGLNPYAQNEKPELEVKEFSIDPGDNNKARYDYTLNRAPKTLHLKKTNGDWKADLQEELRQKSAGMQTLSDGSQGGFAAAASGEIKHHPRRPR